jgi:ribonuclease-3
MNLNDLEATLGFVFDDKSLLQRALTHRSYLNENPDMPWLDNERLEFLGDSILGFVTAEHLYHRFPEMKEGDLTSLRAALVRGQTLAEFSTQLDLGPYLFISRGEETGRGRARPALLAATFEAILGALYLDQGIEAARALVVRMIDGKVQSIVQERLDRNAKSLLQELSQGRLKLTPVYRLVEMHGPDHAREFTVQAVLGERVYGVGQGRNKQAAEQEAARAAISQLENEFYAAEVEAQAALDALTRQAKQGSPAGKSKRESEPEPDFQSPPPLGNGDHPAPDSQSAAS